MCRGQWLCTDAECAGVMGAGGRGVMNALGVAADDDTLIVGSFDGTLGTLWATSSV